MCVTPNRLDQRGKRWCKECATHDRRALKSKRPTIRNVEIARGSIVYTVTPTIDTGFRCDGRKLIDRRFRCDGRKLAEALRDTALWPRVVEHVVTATKGTRFAVAPCNSKKRRTGKTRSKWVKNPKHYFAVRADAEALQNQWEHVLCDKARKLVEQAALAVQQAQIEHAEMQKVLLDVEARQVHVVASKNAKRSAQPANTFGARKLNERSLPAAIKRPSKRARFEVAEQTENAAA